MKTKELTGYGQTILDLICDRVTEVNGMGFVGWVVGKTADIVAHCSAILGRSIPSVAAALGDLIKKGYLTNESRGERSGRLFCTSIIVQHKGWLAYSRRDDQRIVKDNRAPYGDTLEDWLQWDGADGMPYPYEYEIAFTGKTWDS